VVAVAAPDGGPLRRAQAANRGLDAASGDFALFLDDDDLLLPDHLSRLAGTLQSQPDAPAAFADVVQGRFEAGLWQPLHCFEASFDPIRLLFENYLPIHGVLFRRSLPGARPRFDETFDLFEDWDFWLQMAAHGAFAHLPGVSARYVVSGVQQSDVFSESAIAQATRARLYEKWRHRSTPEEYAAVLKRLQSVYREASQARAQVQMLRTDEVQWRQVVAAREEEIASAARMIDGLQGIVAARDRELASAVSQVADLRNVLAERDRDVTHAASQIADLQNIIGEREREITHAASQIASLQTVIGERDREIANARDHIAGLDQILARRQEEIANAMTEIAALRDVLAARDKEIADQARQLESLAAASARKDAQIAELQNEGPVRALKRTLKNKLNGPR
jgi:uncharacterized coiled-coil protein SlyX